MGVGVALLTVDLAVLGMGVALLDGLAVVPWSTRPRSLLARIASILKGYY